MPIIEEIEEIPGIAAASRRQALPFQLQSIPNRKPISNSGPRKVLFVFLKWVIMTFVLTLFLFFIGFAALVVLHFFLTSSAVQHHRRRRRRPVPISPHDSVNQPDSPVSIQEFLPCVSYSSSEQTTKDCAICLEGLREEDLCRKLPNCAHLFHAFCVDSWLAKKLNCPICRTRVQLDWGTENNSDDEWKFWWPVGA